MAFRTGSKQFVNFVTRLEKLQLHDHHNRIVTQEMVADHDRAFSIYFCDPYGHQLEITTYEYDATKIAMRQLDQSTPE